MFAEEGERRIAELRGLQWSKINRKGCEMLKITSVDSLDDSPPVKKTKDLISAQAATHNRSGFPRRGGVMSARD